MRFEVGIRALAPELSCIAPVRDSGMTRDRAIAFAEEHGLPIDVSKRSPYSIDQNLWGRTAECGVLEDPWIQPPEDVFVYTADPTVARAADEVTISFVDGIPTALDGRPLSHLRPGRRAQHPRRRAGHRAHRPDRRPARRHQEP